MSDNNQADASQDMRNQHGALSWAELMTTDTNAAADFYHKVLGWTEETHDIGMGPYTCFTNSSGKAVAGAMPPPPNVPEGTPPHWSMYITVDDVDAAVAAAESNGGTIVCPPMDVPSVGRMAHFSDPQGAMIAVITYETPIG